MSTAPQINKKAAGETRNIAVSFSGKLDAGELLTGTPLVVDASPPSPEVLTIGSIAVSTTELTINGVTVPIGEAVQFSVAGGVADTSYNIQLTTTTDSTPAQTLVDTIILEVTA